MIVLPPPAANETVDKPVDEPAGRTVEPDEIVPPSSRRSEERRSEARARATGGAGSGADAFTAGIDVSAILTKSFEIAGLIQPAPADAPRKPSTAPLGIDIPNIIATSFEAAGLFKRAHPRGSAPRGGRAGYAGNTARRPADAPEPKAAADAGVPDRIDLQTILTRSFEASGLLKTVTAAPPSDAAADETAAGAPSEDSGEWRLLAGGAEKTSGRSWSARCRRALVAP